MTTATIPTTLSKVSNITHSRIMVVVECHSSSSSKHSLVEEVRRCNSSGVDRDRFIACDLVCIDGIKTVWGVDQSFDLVNAKNDHALLIHAFSRNQRTGVTPARISLLILLPLLISYSHYNSPFLETSCITQDIDCTHTLCYLYRIPVHKLSRNEGRSSHPTCLSFPKSQRPLDLLLHPVTRYWPLSYRLSNVNPARRNRRDPVSKLRRRVNPKRRSPRQLPLFPQRDSPHQHRHLPHALYELSPLLNGSYRKLNPRQRATASYHLSWRPVELMRLLEPIKLNQPNLPIPS